MNKNREPSGSRFDFGEGQWVAGLAAEIRPFEKLPEQPIGRLLLKVVASTLPKV
jgi:hypothetical protein